MLLLVSPPYPLRSRCTCFVDLQNFLGFSSMIVIKVIKVNESKSNLTLNRVKALLQCCKK